MGREQLERRSDLAQRVEGVFMEEHRIARSYLRGMRLNALGKRLHRVAQRGRPHMRFKQSPRGGLESSAFKRGIVEFYIFRIRKKIVTPRPWQARSLKYAVKILGFKIEKSGIVKIRQPSAFTIE